MTRVRLLTGTVIGMGVLILIGLIVLVIGIVYKAGVADGPETTAPQRGAAPAAAGELRTDPVSLGLPAESIVLRMTNIRGGLAVLVRLCPRASRSSMRSRSTADSRRCEYRSPARRGGN